MAIIDTVFRVAPELITTDPTEITRINAFIADAQMDAPIKSSHAKYERWVAYQAAGLITQSDESTPVNGYGLKREKSSRAENEYQTNKTGTGANKYFDLAKQILGLAGRNWPSVIAGS